MIFFFFFHSIFSTAEALVIDVSTDAAALLPLPTGLLSNKQKGGYRKAGF